MATAKAKGTAKAKPRPRRRYAAKLKTTVNDASVSSFIAKVPDAGQRADSRVIADLMAKVSKAKAKMWGSAIVGYGDYHYVGRSGREGDWFLCGFSPRKGNMTLYVLGGWRHTPALLAALGPHKLGGGCLYLKRLDDVDPRALTKLVTASYKRAVKLRDSGATELI